MGGFDNETSREFSKQNREHQNKFIGHRTKLHKQWKELGLKSHYLLKQIENMTSQKKDGEVIVNEKYEPIASFIDMIQDIVVPKQCTEADRERAGIPSVLTNVT